MIQHLATLDATATDHIITLKDLMNMKYQAFLKITEVKYEMNNFQEEVEKNQVMNEKTQLKNHQNSNDISYTVKKHTKTKHKISLALEDHQLKLSATYTFLATTPCELTCNADTYPILRSEGK